MITYFKNIWDTAATVFEGMAITLSYMFQKPITVQYPDRLKEPVPHTLPTGYRGRLALDVDLCTACALCQKACPIDVIDMKGMRTEGKKGLTLIYFNIYHGKCMYCNLCVEACPAEDEESHQTALYFKKDFEGVALKSSDLIEQFIPQEQAKALFKEATDFAEKRAKEKKQAESAPKPEAGA